MLRFCRSLVTIHFIGADNWGLENLHGIQTQCFKSKDGTTQHCPTILPVLASAAASFDRDTWRAMGEMLSTEQRASNNNRGLRGNRIGTPSVKRVGSQHKFDPRSSLGEIDKCLLSFQSQSIHTVASHSRGVGAES